MFDRLSRYVTRQRLHRRVRPARLAHDADIEAAEIGEAICLGEDAHSRSHAQFRHRAHRKPARHRGVDGIGIRARIGDTELAAVSLEGVEHRLAPFAAGMRERDRQGSSM